MNGSRKKPVTVAAQFRLAEPMYKLLKRAAARAGLTLSAWLRDRALRAARRELRETRKDGE